jgi:hypothetical protein
MNKKLINFLEKRNEILSIKETKEFDLQVIPSTKSSPKIPPKDINNPQGRLLLVALLEVIFY